MVADSARDPAVVAAIGIVGAVIVGILIEGLVLMGIFRKANQPVGYAFIPIVNLLYILKIVGRPWWWILLFLIPCLGFILWIVVAVRPRAGLRARDRVHARAHLLER